MSTTPRRRRLPPVSIPAHYVDALGETTCRKIAREVMIEHSLADIRHLAQANLLSILDIECEAL